MMADDRHDQHLPEGIAEDTKGGYLYRQAQLLVDGSQEQLDEHGSKDLDEIRRRLGERISREERLPGGIVLIDLQPIDEDLGPIDIPSLVEDLRHGGTEDDQGRPLPMLSGDKHGGSHPGRHAQTLPVFPNHVFSGGKHGGSHPGPGCPPRPADRATTTIFSMIEASPDVCVAVLDSGVDVTHPWFAGGAVVHTDSQPEGPPVPVNGTLGLYAGHGTFIAGLIRQHAPQAQILALRVFEDDGFVDEAQLAKTIASLTDQGVHVVSLSLGGFSYENLPPPGLAAALRVLRASSSAPVVVASAGNDSTTRPAWPAAFKDVIGVAALNEDETGPACFTNSGPWVDASTKGVNLVSSFFTSVAVAAPFPADRPNCLGVEPAAQGFCGYATWSGTSFAAPVVAAVIARQPGADKDPEAAAFAVLHAAELFPQPGLGVHVTL